MSATYLRALSTSCARALTVLAEGGTLIGSRTFPLPHTFQLKQLPTPCPASVVSELVELRLIAPVLKGAQRKGDSAAFDRIEYRITPLGETASARGGEVAYSDWGTTP